METPDQIIRPIPRRAFDVTPTSPEQSLPHTPSPGSATPGYVSPAGASKVGSSPGRTKSYLNLTTSTLFGIYSPAEGLDNEKTAPPTPQPLSPPAGRLQPLSDEKQSRTVESPDISKRPTNRPSFHTPKPSPASLLVRNSLLFLSGLAYGTVVTHLHDDRRIVPIEVKHINQHSYGYLAFWAVAGVILGNLLPFIDVKYAHSAIADEDEVETVRHRRATHYGLFDRHGKFTPDWQSVIRGVGAFVGIAYAIRNLPWESTLQVSLTLAFANPALWYLIDRTTSGFLLSFFTALVGTIFTLVIAPGVVPSPKTTSSSWSTEPLSFERLRSTECIGVATWIASVLFCSCVSFGNIGRRLALPRDASIAR